MTNLVAKNRCLRTLVAGIVLSTGTAAAGPAPPQPAIDLGQTSFVDAEGGVGTLVEVIGSGYGATHATDAGGHRGPGAFTQVLGAALFHVAYTSDIELLDAKLGGEILVPVARVALRAGSLDAVRAGVGDATLGAYLQWSDLQFLGRPLSVRLDLDVIVTTGSYDRMRDVNIGYDLWQIEPYVAFSWRPTDAWEVSSRIIYDRSGASGAPPISTQLRNWQPGDQVAVNLSASYAVAPNWRLGLAGYTLQQISDAHANGDSIIDTRQETFGVGPGAMWTSGNLTLIGNIYKEFGAQNRAEGYQGVLRLLLVY